MKKRIVIFSGAGISAESGIKTFREGGGLWETYKIEEVATPQAWKQDPKVVIDFYNNRRKQIVQSQPNAAHYALVELEKKFDVRIITQNIDDLHERAGSKNVLHLHGEILKSRSSGDCNLVYKINGWEMKHGELCEKGYPLRPHIVWFGETIPLMETACTLVSTAAIFIIIGTSLTVYPAANLVNFVAKETITYWIDSNAARKKYTQNLVIKRENAGIAVPMLVKNLLI